MKDEEKIIRVKTFKDFERELGRYGDETLEVPAWIAEAIPPASGTNDTIATDSPRGVLPGGFVWRVGRE